LKKRSLFKGINRSTFERERKVSKTGAVKVVVVQEEENTT